MDYGVLVAPDLWSGVGCAAGVGGRGIDNLDYPPHHIAGRVKRSCRLQFNLVPVPDLVADSGAVVSAPDTSGVPASRVMGIC